MSARGRVRAGATLIARGEFSIAVPGLATAAGIDPDFEALAVSHVFILAIAGPILAKLADPIVERLVPKESRGEVLHYPKDRAGYTDRGAPGSLVGNYV